MMTYWDSIRDAIDKAEKAEDMNVYHEARLQAKRALASLVEKLEQMASSSQVPVK